MADGIEPLPQRPRRAFGVKARGGGGGEPSNDSGLPGAPGLGAGEAPSESSAPMGGRDVSSGGGWREAAGERAAGAREHISIGIADGCGYNEAVQYVGEGGERPLDEGEKRNYEYLDHTADVQFHAWGDSLEEAFEQVVVCMFSYITDLHTVESLGSNEVEVSGHDMQSLLYNFMDEFLFQFCTDGFVARRVEIESFDKTAFAIRAKGYGEKFQARVKHPQGTEIKAITYSAMQINVKHSGESDVYVIVDI